MKYCELKGLACLLGLLALSSLGAFAATNSLVARSDTWHYMLGTNAPVSDWKTRPDAALGSEWRTGPGGFGYADSDDATVLSTMRYNFTTVYIRKTFTVSGTFDPAHRLFLRMDYDDGFVAYLDGQEIDRSSNTPTGVGVEPAYNSDATADHEASAGSTAAAVRLKDLGLPGALLTPGEHVLAVIGMNDTIDSSDLSLIVDLFTSEPPPDPPGTIGVNTNWTLAQSPIIVTNNLTVKDGVTLTIEPGVVVKFNQGLGITFNGLLNAQGTAEQPILFTTNAPATGWGRLLFNANLGESRFIHCIVDGAKSGGNIRGLDTSLFLDHVTWTNTTVQLLDVTDSSIIVSNCYFPTVVGDELLHFSNMPGNGHAIIANNYFGTTIGYNDIIDLTGGNRPGPIAQFYNNIFNSSVDDCLDMDGTDAHIEGNIFINVRQDTARDSTSNPISTGSDGSALSELTIVRNLFYNCEHAFLLKDRGSAVIQNNTVLKISGNPVSTITNSVFNFSEPHRASKGGYGALVDGNIFWDIQDNRFTVNFTNSAMYLDVNHCIVPGTNYPGIGNLTNDPMFVSMQGITYENIRSKLALLPGSPAIGAGPNGLDMGAIVPAGATISGEPAGATTNTSATLTVAGPGIFAYKWKLNDGPWSPELSLVTGVAFTNTMFNTTNRFIHLASLPEGTHTVYVVGKNSGGYWQDTNAPTTKSWTVQAQGTLEFTSIERNGNQVQLNFVAEAGKTYRIDYSPVLPATSWTKLTDITPQATTGNYTVPDSLAAGEKRFYRLVEIP